MEWLIPLASKKRSATESAFSGRVAILAWLGEDQTAVQKPVVISFDRDGTLEWGIPPGPITAADLKMLSECGVVIGGGSTAEAYIQLRAWEQHGVPPAFVYTKDVLPQLVTSYPGCTWYHVDDQDIQPQGSIRISPEAMKTWLEKVRRDGSMGRP